MKLIITGASGFVGGEVVRQSLRMKEFTSVIALARTPVAVPKNLLPGSDPSKLKSVVIKDYTVYGDEIKKEFAGAGACIWTVAITPSRSKARPWEEVVKVNQEAPLAAIKAIYAADTVKPFRFLFMSGVGLSRDPDIKVPWYNPYGAYMKLRGATEVQLLEFAAEHKGELEAGAVAIGLAKGVSGELGRNVAVTVVTTIGGLIGGPLAGGPVLNVDQVAIADLRIVLNGFEKDPYKDDDVVRIAREYNETQA